MQNAEAEVPNPATVSALERARSWLHRRLGHADSGVPDAAGAELVFDAYVDAPPCAQNAVDAVPGWTTAFPPEFGVSAGPLGLTGDARIAWLVDRLGGVQGLSVLELGPLDGGHTSMLHAAGAGAIDAVEANRLAFLRCLITKEIQGLHRARFYLGDFTRGFGALGPRWDLVVASGVLYHLQEPYVLLEALSERTDTLFLWTHVYDSTATPADDPRLGPFTGVVESRRAGGATVAQHERRYLGAHHAPSFCGGTRDRHVWMAREGLFSALAALGFDDIAVAHDDPYAPAGAALAVLARRSAAP